MQKNNNVSTVIMFNSSNSSLSLSYYVIFVSCANQDILLKLYVKMHYPPPPPLLFLPFPLFFHTIEFGTLELIMLEKRTINL